ncbi:hypothetical protein EES41_00990 [Streptomyces sp. ADI95-16]|nr:hypothetical protein EES41_00990 [Streptomyces sp. ADI95-16]
MHCRRSGTPRYEAVEGNRLLGITGAQLRRDLHVSEQDLAAACTYLAGEGLITVDIAAYTANRYATAATSKPAV